MNIYFTISPTFFAIANSQDTGKIGNQVSGMHQHKILPQIVVQPESSARRMADNGPGWVMVQKSPKGYFLGVNAYRQLNQYEVYTLEQIAKAQNINLTL